MDDLLEKILNKELEILPDKQYFRDGGTIGFMVRGANGQQTYLYLDRRINTDTRDVFYANGYPGKEGAVELGKNEELVTMLTKTN